MLNEIVTWIKFVLLVCPVDNTYSSYYENYINKVLDDKERYEINFSQDKKWLHIKDKQIDGCNNILVTINIKSDSLYGFMGEIRLYENMTMSHWSVMYRPKFSTTYRIYKEFCQYKKSNKGIDDCIWLNRFL